ncbi:MAG TPA: hypothetical protein VMU33_12780 [Burkholderiaceae bacterium]|nr:hypothetical protein [Burkholderiaceae bacterium]
MASTALPVATAHADDLDATGPAVADASRTLPLGAVVGRDGSVDDPPIRTRRGKGSPQSEIGPALFHEIASPFTDYGTPLNLAPSVVSSAPNLRNLRFVRDIAGGRPPQHGAPITDTAGPSAIGTRPINVLPPCNYMLTLDADL